MSCPCPSKETYRKHPSLYICNQVTHRWVLKTSALGKKIQTCIKSHGDSSVSSVLLGLGPPTTTPSESPPYSPRLGKKLKTTKKMKTTKMVTAPHSLSSLRRPPSSYMLSYTILTSAGVWKAVKFLFSSSNSDTLGIRNNAMWFQHQIRYLQSLPAAALDLLLQYTTDSSKIHTAAQKRHIHQLIVKAPRLEFDLVVWRGILHDYIRKEPSQLFRNQDKFISTSLLKDVSLHPFFIGAECCLLKIHLPRTCPALWLPLGPSEREKEILLPEESQFFIQKVEYTPRKVYQMQYVCSS